MTAAVTVDAAGARMGGAARYLVELRGYLERTGREDVEIIGAQQRVGPGWLMRRELGSLVRSRRVAINNVGFVAPGGQRWTLLRNAPGCPPFGCDRRTIYRHDRAHRGGPAGPEQPCRGAAAPGLRPLHPAPAR